MRDTRSLDNDEYYHLSENRSWLMVLQSFVLTDRIWDNPKFQNRNKECSVCLASPFQYDLLCSLPQFFQKSCIDCTIAVKQYLLDHAHKLSLGNGVDK